MISNCNLTLQSAMNPCWPSFKKPRIYTFIFLARRVRYWKFINPRRILNESHILGSGNVLIRARRNGVVLSVHDRVRENLRGQYDLRHSHRCCFSVCLSVRGTDPTGMVLVRDLRDSSETIAL
jgi:hypothetical protein